MNKIENENLELIIQKGIDYLFSKRSENGLWTDYTNLAGGSDEWVTGYVGSAIANVDLIYKDLLMKSWRKLTRRRIWSKGWGYNIKVPSDADTTCWVATFAESIGKHNSYFYKNSIKFIQQHLNAQGGVSTYRKTGAIRNFTKLSKKISFDGWCSEHVCVTAAVANLSYFENNISIRDFLIKSQNEEGFWESYWWKHPEYATCFVVELLAKYNLKYEENLQKAIHWLLKELEKSEQDKYIYKKSPFIASFALRTLLSVNINDNNIKSHILKLTNQLIELQNDNGSWNSSALMRIPPPHILNPENFKKWNYTGGIATMKFDPQRLFTTATVLTALAKLKNRVIEI